MKQKHYYIDGQEVSLEAAQEVLRENQRYAQYAVQTGDMSYLLNCKFIYFVEK